MAMADAATLGRLDGSRASLDPDDAINIQFTSGTTGSPKGATLTHDNILNNARFVTATMDFSEADRLCIPVPLYHCFGMVMGTLGCVTKGAAMVFPGEGFEPRRHAEGGRRRALHGALRRADDVRRRAGASRISRPSTSRSLRTGMHGRLALPDRGDEEGRLRHAHAGGDDRLRHDRDEPGLLPEQHHRPDRTARVDRRPRAAASRGQDRRSRGRQHRAGRRARRALHPRLFGDAGLLGRRRTARARRSTPRAGCTPATSARSTPRAIATSSAASRTW